MVASASAAPPAAAPGRNHPTYTNMITHALAQLGGASARSAIAGFISASFTGLPVSHDALLTAHLRRLVAEGVLCTSGFSFVFSDHSPTRPAEATDLDSDDESAGDSADDDDDDAYTPLLHLPVRVPVLGEKRGRGRPRKTVEHSPANAGGVRRPRGRPRKVMVMLSAHTNTTTFAQLCPAKGEHSVLSSQRDGVTKRGRGRPRKIQQSPSPSPGGDPSTACIIKSKRGPGRPRKEDQQSEATKHLPTPPASRGFKVGCGRPMLVAPASASADTWPPMSWRPIIIDKLPPARCSVDPLAESARVKRPRGRPRIYTPSAAMSAETGDPETVDAASMGIKRGHGWPIKENPSAAAAMLAETEAGDAVSMGIKRGRGRPRKEKPAAAMLAETEAGDAASAGIKRGRGRPRKEKPAAAAMLAETEAGDAVSTGIKRGRGRPRKEKPAAAAAAMLALL